MPPWTSVGVIPPSLPEHCEPANEFLYKLSSSLHTCIPTNLALLSTLLGALSIVSWLFAQLPQIYKNYKIKSTAGLSVYFLIEWCLGDASNLLGALFTRQAAWQVVVAGYYVCVDVVLVGQWFWYEHIMARWSRSNVYYDGGLDYESGRGEPDGVLDGVQPDGSSISDREQDQKQSRLFSPNATKAARQIFRNPNFSSSPPSKEDTGTNAAQPFSINRAQPGTSPIVSLSPRTMLYVSLLCALLSAHPTMATQTETSDSQADGNSAAEAAGRILSWLSTLLYLGSRLPQLYKNHVRRSTAGLSPFLFIAAFFGNLFYSSSLLANPCAWNDFPSYGGGGWVGEEGNDRWEWIGRAAPFWLGAAGVLALDATMGIQFLLFGEHGKTVVIRDREAGRWRRVSGWMRGWMPSMSSSSKNTGADAQRLLYDDTDGYGTV